MRLLQMTTRRWMVVVAMIGQPTGMISASYREAERLDPHLYRTRRHTQSWPADAVFPGRVSSLPKVAPMRSINAPN
jgi:hypothetical protein